jgi:membrane associated rhomboid family serine protease
MFAIPDWVPLQRLAIAVAVAVGALVVWWLDRPRGRWGDRLRRRWVLGIPWGTLTTVLGVLAVYLFVQDGLARWYAPVTLPFRAWSYFYPVGMVTASFSHVGPGHLIGNLVGTLTFAPLAEFAFGHFPRERGSSSFGSARTNPFVRAFVIVPAAAAVVGLLSAAFAIGPVIGFSSVVFAFAGFALVYYPLSTVVAVSVGGVLRLAYNAAMNPRTVAESRPSFSSPWWADIAIQGHALGLLVGVVLGAWMLRSRGDEGPSALRLWTGALVFAVAESLWAVYWFRGNATYVLFRAVGLALVVALATLVVLAVRASDRSLVAVPRLDRPGVDRSRLAAIDLEWLRSTPRWQAAVVVLLLATAVMSGPAVPYNLTVVGDDPLPGESIQVRGYEITYAENVPNGLTAAFDVSAFGETTTVNASGVIVRNPDRSIWTTAVPKSRLAFSGRNVVRVGGVGWREGVLVTRDGWKTVGGNRTYRIAFRNNGTKRIVYTAPPARVRPVVAGRNVSVNATPETFLLRVTHGDETAVAPLPTRNESVSLEGITFARKNRTVVATYGATRIRVVSKERYLGRRS